ncbi:hypothetical protein GCM10011506_09030 [Marivirga lumbricoides]|uniref:Linear amide C-N hydrolase n=1 Tax=Marivirga lumbricoides TaxID=1046115 RepID=A0ABQ1LKP8_9BACT|nr:hypothetical protein GCM10011506_09030 [Marivirga lumbricoides]
MKKYKSKLTNQIIITLIICFLLYPFSNFACTTVSAIARNGHVWNANNEDGPKGIANFLNVFPKLDNTKYGYFTLSYMSPRNGTGGSIQGGMNEAGLTFDFDAIDWVEDFDPSNRKVFPSGNDAILPHILANMSTVEEVIAFFTTYWFQNGFRGAQMHVADRNGRFAIISASGIQLVEKGENLVSTNFDICGKEDGSSCWRYPIAKAKLAEYGASLATMMDICRATSQKTGGTMYSNIQNLSTGEVWLFSQHNPGITVHTNIHEMLRKGQKSYTFNDLKSLIEERPITQWTEPHSAKLAKEEINQFSGVYHNYYIGKIIVEEKENTIVLTFEDGMSLPLIPSSTNIFYLPKERVKVEFEHDDERDKMAIKLYEDNYWSFTAWDNSSQSNN